MRESVQSMNKKENCAGMINAVLLLLFLAGAVAILFCGDLTSRLPVCLNGSPLWVMGLILLTDVLMCLSPLSLAFQPLLIFTLGSAACAEAQRIMRGTAADEFPVHLLLLFLLVLSCFMLGGRGLYNALLMIRIVRRDPAVLGRSVKYTCVPVLFGLAVFYLLCRILRFQ